MRGQAHFTKDIYIGVMLCHAMLRVKKKKNVPCFATSLVCHRLKSDNSQLIINQDLLQ